MKVSASNYQNYNLTSFKSTYPVAYWVRDVNGKIVREHKMRKIEDFQKEIVRFLNTIPLTKNNIKKMSQKRNKKPLRTPIDEILQKLGELITEKDTAYRQNPTVRSFYNYNVTGRNFSYIISGDDVADFNNRYAKELGRQTKAAGGQETPGLIKARNNYNYGGYDYVNNYEKRLKTDGRTQILNILYDIVRNDKNEITGYKIADFNFKDEFHRG